MATRDRWIFYGEARLWREGRFVVPSSRRGVTQEFQGVSRADTYVYPGSPNFSHTLEAHTLFSPLPSQAWPTYESFIQHYEAMRELLEARAAASRRYPVVLVDDGSTRRTVSAVSGSGTINVTTSAAHGLTTGDRVLICRAGDGNYTVGAVTVVDSDEFTIAANHTIAISDEVYLVNAYWNSRIYVGMTKPDKRGRDGHYYIEDCVYTFVGKGSGADYRRRTIDLRA